MAGGARGVEATVRPIVEEPPTAAELAKLIPASDLPARKWLNTSGMSYRAIGKEKVDAADEATITRWLTEDGQAGEAARAGAGGPRPRGFREEQYEEQYEELFA